MMVHISMDVDVYDVTIHGWADNAHRTPSHLPSTFHHATSALMPVPSHLPDGYHAPQDDMQCLCLRESMAMAAPRERTHSIPKRLHKKKKLSMRLMKEETIKSRQWTYLFPIMVSMFRVGCRVCVCVWSPVKGGGVVKHTIPIAKSSPP
jgi:hypothetical protein